MSPSSRANLSSRSTAFGGLNIECRAEGSRGLEWKPEEVSDRAANCHRAARRACFAWPASVHEMSSKSVQIAQRSRHATLSGGCTRDKEMPTGSSLPVASFSHDSCLARRSLGICRLCLGRVGDLSLPWVSQKTSFDMRLPGVTCTLRVPKNYKDLLRQLPNWGSFGNSTGSCRLGLVYLLGRGSESKLQGYLGLHQVYSPKASDTGFEKKWHRSLMGIAALQM